MPRKPEDADVEFATSTSLHGVQHLVEQRPLVYKIGWGLLIIGAIALCVWQITDRVKAYFSYPTAKEHEEINAIKMIFPTVTICSSYRTRDDLLPENERRVLQSNSPHYKRSENFNRLMFEDIVNFQNIYVANYKKQTSLLYPKGFSFSDMLLSNAYKLTNETLIICQFNDENCNVEDFFFLFTLDFEICWTFNSHLNTKIPLNQEDAGPANGLISIIDFERDKHTTILQTSILSKFNLYLSPHGEVPLGFNDVMPVSPGQVIHVKLDYTKNKHLPYPYGNCNEKKNLPPYGTNTLQNCLAKCHIEYIKKYSSCQPFIYSGFYSNPGNYCDFKDLFLPYLHTSDEIPDIDCSSCASSCTEEKYSATIYYTEPLDNTAIQNLMKTRNVTPDYIKRNYLILNIFFDNFVYHVTEEKTVMTVASLLSDIGGTLGLFMGMSILTIAEILTYVARRCKLTLKSKKCYMQGKGIERPKENIELKEHN